MKLNEKQKSIVTALVFIGVLGGLGALNYGKLRTRFDLLDQLDQYREEERLANDKMRRIPELREQRSKLINIIDQYAEILPREQHVQHDAFVEIIDGYRRDTQIVIQRTEYLKPKVKKAKKGQAKKTKENFIRHRYRFKLVGTVPDFLRFINKIENHIRFLKIDAISIKPLGAPDVANEMDERGDIEEIQKARIPFKDIELTVSTYTYSKGELGKR